MDGEYVKLERAGGSVCLNLSGRYPQELYFYPKARQIRRMARFFLSAGKRSGRFRARLRSEDLRFTLSIRAKRIRGRANPVLTFGYRYFNDRFDKVSDSFSRYPNFGSEALRRFGQELLLFEKSGKALLIQN